MKSGAYYNEHDQHAANWLRNLIQSGLIADGDVDERSIVDVRPDEIRDYRHAHFFAGIGVWSYALRRAGWPDDRPVWTGSCPCQPFSAAGRRGGLADERHLWPHWHWLIHQCRPETIFGEQVASKDGLAWLDVVCADLEGSGYAGWVGDLCAAGVGAPQIRQRIFFVANAERARDGDARSGQAGNAQSGMQRAHGQREWLRADAGQSGSLRSMARAEGERLQRRPYDEDEGRRQRASGQGCEAGELEYAACDGWNERRSEPSEWGVERGCGPIKLGDADEPRLEGWGLSERGRSDECALGSAGDLVRPGPTNGFWRDADWIGCTDGKWRPVEPESFPLVHGSAFRLGSGGAFEGKSRAKMLKGYGNAIVAPLAAEFIAAAMEFLP